MQNPRLRRGIFIVCGGGRQPIQRDKTANDTYYLLTLAAIAQELQARGVPRECNVTIAAGLPLTSYGREKPAFRKYLLRNAGQATEFGYEGKKYRITIEDVLLFPQGFTALMTQPDLLADEPSMLLLDIGGWTVDLMRIDNGRPIKRPPAAEHKQISQTTIDQVPIRFLSGNRQLSRRKRSEPKRVRQSEWKNIGI